MEAQERWVLEQVHPLHRAEAAVALLPSRLRPIVVRMGHRYYKVRDRAKAELIRLGADVGPAMVIGQYVGDVEIAFRCRGVLRAVSRCPDCHGQGHFKGDWDTVVGCEKCKKRGFLWPIPEFDRWNLME
jgi:hypothetical protein